MVMKRRLLLILGLLLASLLVIAQMKDVPKNHWAYEAVKMLVDRGIFTGYPDGTFKGNRTLTRYEFAVTFWRTVQYIDRIVKEKAEQLSMNAVSPVDFERLSIYVEALANKVAQLEKDTALKGEYAYKEDVERLDTLVETLAKKVGEIYGDLQSVKNVVADVETLKGSVKDLKASMVSPTDFEKLSIFVEALKSKVGEIEGKLEGIDELSNEVKTLKKEVAGKAELERTNVIIDVLSKKLVDVETTLADKADKSYVDEKVKGIESKLGDYMTSEEYYDNIDYFYSELDNIKSNVDLLMEAIDVLREDTEGKFSEYDAELADQKDTNELFNNRMNALDMMIRKLKLDLKGVTTQVDDLGSAVDSLSGDVEGLKSSVADLKKDVDALTLNSNLHEKDITEIFDRLGTLENKAESLSKDLYNFSTDLQGQIVKVDARVTAVERNASETVAELSKKVEAKADQSLVWISMLLGIVGIGLAAFAAFGGG